MNLKMLLSGSAGGFDSPTDPGLMVPVVTMVAPDGVVMTPSAVFDSTGQYCFNLDSLASAATYDANGNVLTMTYGPDQRGKSIRKTSTWSNGIWAGDSAWVLV